MKVLFLSQIVPYPPHGGVLQRGYNLLRELGRDACVHLLAFVHPDVLPTEAACRDSKVALSNEAPETDVTALNKLPSWPVSISYYPIEGNGDDEPVYQASFTMLENGISTDLVLDFGTYALAGKLSKLVLLKAEPCK